MSFVRKTANLTPIVDTVFSIVKLAQQDKMENGPEHVVDATIGSLYDESGTLVAYKSFFDHYNAMDNKSKAKYAASFTGNESFRHQVINWVFQNHAPSLTKKVIATPGGSGAISTTFNMILDQNETVILPEIAWGSYKLMAQQNCLNTISYSMFEEDHFNLSSFKQVCTEVLNQQHKLLVVINDPCHNPTGYSLSHEEWNEIIAFLNECSKQGPVVILNDIAYIDYGYNQNEIRSYYDCFEKLNDNVFLVVAFSISKTCTSYGLRCGAAVLCAKDPQQVREVEIVFEKAARATWSNIPNAAMDNFSWVTTENLENFLNEKQSYIDLLKQRSSIFLKEAKEANLPIYPYKEGFFVTVKIDNDLKQKYHEALMKEHIYTVQVNKGIRVAVCSLPVEKCYGLAQRMKKILDSIK
ncbi:MAG: aminotransferase class I/II-fold pyridoxal phosphate-dependent enzyme [Erysipelotrichaceae bacterium]|nr:aminotransferase class I/II-fold pyridoxal phosphate-dependent enzyme [Erysipelotrichaceae bacterium]